VTVADVLSESPSPRILLAEDSGVIRAMVRKVLEAAGYSVVEAANGQLALELCIESRPDVALLDVEMPVLDGRQLLLRLKSDPNLSHIPVIFLTSRTSTAEIVEGLRIGAHDYLRKPFEPAELIARVSAALRVARLQQELSKQNAVLSLLSITDPLTGLANRRYGEERLRTEIETATRHQQPLTLLMLDADHFKQVNDRYGHSGGDAVLKELARRMQGVLRVGDIAARWGGEEFLLVLPNTALPGAIALAERLLEEMRGIPIAVGADQSCVVTASIGAAEGGGKNFEELLRRADDALYQAKHDGRDCVRLAQ
jgi:two-component system cell cycle response regulator